MNPNEYPTQLPEEVARALRAWITSRSALDGMSANNGYRPSCELTEQANAAALLAYFTQHGQLRKKTGPAAPLRKPPTVEHGIPRRNRIDLFVPAERAIYDATAVVEAAGASRALTDAVTLLGKARDRVADHVDFGD